mmetsp:Transcript_78414/g.168055  ORF Transcript_78414/g.168055 Transcript_78414/m.168055 type:complete len:247 (-) Transcript_78414:74-814(-)
MGEGDNPKVLGDMAGGAFSLADVCAGKGEGGATCPSGGDSPGVLLHVGDMTGGAFTLVDGCASEGEGAASCRSGGDNPVVLLHGGDIAGGAFTLADGCAGEDEGGATLRSGGDSAGVLLHVGEKTGGAFTLAGGFAGKDEDVASIRSGGDEKGLLLQGGAFVRSAVLLAICDCPFALLAIIFGARPRHSPHASSGCPALAGLPPLATALPNFSPLQESSSGGALYLDFTGGGVWKLSGFAHWYFAC